MALGPLWHEVSFGVRILRRSPSFTIAAALSLTLGIAATSAGFGIFNGLFLSSLPYPAADRLLYLHETAPAWSMPYLAVSYVDMDGWRRANRSFEDVAGLLQKGAELTGFGDTMHVNVASVTYNLARTLGIAPVRGRGFRAEDDRAGQHTAMLTYTSWQRWFGGSWTRSAKASCSIRRHTR